MDAFSQRIQLGWHDAKVVFALGLGSEDQGSSVTSQACLLLSWDLCVCNLAWVVRHTQFSNYCPS